MDSRQSSSRPWYADARGRLIYGSIGAEWWGSLVTSSVAALVLLYPVPANRRGFLLDAIGDPVAIDGFLYLLIVVCLGHFVMLWLPNTRRRIIWRKLALALEATCWSSVVFDLYGVHQLGSLPSVGILAVLMWIGIARRQYPPL